MHGFTSANRSFEVVSSIEEESTDEMALNERFMQVCSARSSEHFFDGAVGSASGIVFGASLWQGREISLLQVLEVIEQVQLQFFVVVPSGSDSAAE